MIFKTPFLNDQFHYCSQFTTFPRELRKFFTLYKESWHLGAKKIAFLNSDPCRTQNFSRHYYWFHCVSQTWWRVLEHLGMGYIFNISHLTIWPTFWKSLPSVWHGLNFLIYNNFHNDLKYWQWILIIFPSIRHC